VKQKAAGKITIKIIIIILRAFITLHCLVMWLHWLAVILQASASCT